MIASAINNSDIKQSLPFQIVRCLCGPEDSDDENDENPVQVGFVPVQ